MDRLDELSVFLGIFEAGSMAAAAHRLRRSPSAVTRILNGLEQRMNVRLFERSTRRLTPTAEGLRLSQQASTLLADYERVMATYDEASPRGELRITAPMVFGRRHVAPLVTRFLQAYPEIQVDLVLADRNMDLIDHGVDVAVRIGALQESSLVARKVGEVRRVTVASPAYLAGVKPPIEPGELPQHNLILGTAVRGLAEWRFRQGEQEQVVRFTPRLQINDVEAMLGAIRDGFGIGRAMSYQVAPDVARGTLTTLLEAFEPPAFPVQLVFPGTRLMPPRVRAFIDFAVEHLAALPEIGAPPAQGRRKRV